MCILLVACDEPRDEPVDGGGKPHEGGPQLVRVISYHRTPVAGVHLQIGAQQVVTDARGEARFEEVSAPFSLLLDYRYDNFTQRARLIEQRDNPLEIAVGAPEPDLIELTVGGTVSGISASPTSEVRVAVFNGMHPSHAVTATKPAGDFEIQIWEGAEPREVDVVAFEVEPTPNALGAHILRYGSAKLTVDGDAPAPRPIAVSLSAVPQGRLTGHLAAPPPGPFSTTFSILSLAHPGGALQVQEDLAMPTGPFDIPFPVIDGVRAELTFFYFEDDRIDAGFSTVTRRVALPSDALSITLAPPIQAIAPANLVPLSPSLVFRWTSQQGAPTGKYGFTLECEDFTLDPFVVVSSRVETTATELALSSLPEFEAMNPATARCTWRVAWYDAPSAAAWIRGTRADVHHSTGTRTYQLRPTRLP